jgi:hypothetical protein
MSLDFIRQLECLVRCFRARLIRALGVWLNYLGIMDWNTFMMWVRLAIAIIFLIVFVASCIGLGYLVEFLVRHRGWPRWISGLMSFAIAFLWPSIVVCYTIYDARRYSSLHPHDDAPGMVVASVIFVGAPLLFVLSFPLALVGVFIARRQNFGRVFR